MVSDPRYDSRMVGGGGPDPMVPSHTILDPPPPPFWIPPPPPFWIPLPHHTGSPSPTILDPLLDDPWSGAAGPRGGGEGEVLRTCLTKCWVMIIYGQIMSGVSGGNVWWENSCHWSNGYIGLRLRDFGH